MLRFLFLGWIICLPATAQVFSDRETYVVHSEVFSGLPFWRKAREAGIPIGAGPLVIQRTSLSADYQAPSRTRSYLRRRRLDWGYGAEIAVTAGKQVRLLLPEVYIKARAGYFELWAGRRKEVIGLADSLMGTGPFIWSGNALPVPKITAGFPAWTPLGHSGLSFLAVVAHGSLDDPGALVRHVRLHQKYVYIRWKGNRMEGMAGINHQVQWGGRADPGWLHTHSEKMPFFQEDGTLPVDGAAWWSVWTGTRVTGKGYNAYDAGQRVGNHLGTVDLALLFPDAGLFLYRQQPYDMPSLLHLSNLGDGLTGIRFTRSEGLLRTLTLEYLSTRNQGHAGLWREDYFHHLQYVQGWTYRGQVLGTPFLIPDNNRVTVIHAGCQATSGKEIRFEGKLSLLPEAQQVYSLLRLSGPAPYRLGGDWRATAAFDAGRQPGWALSVGWSKTWGFSEENVSDAARYRRRHRR